MNRYLLSLKSIIIMLALLACSDVSAQVNIKVGYAGSYVDVGVADDIFARYNQTVSTGNEDQIAVPDWVNGLEFGLRYKLTDGLRLDGGASFGNSSNKYKSVTLATTDVVSSKWKTSLASYYAGVESQYGFFGIGANIGYQKLSFKNERSTDSDDRTVFSQTVLSSKVYLNLEAPGSNVAVTLRPYVSFNWEPYNLQPLERDLFPSSTTPAADFEQDLMTYGISLLFFNGPQ